MSYTISDKAVHGDKHGLVGMTFAFHRAMGSHEEMLAATPETVADALLATWRIAGYLDIQALPKCLYRGDMRFAEFPYSLDALMEAKPVLSEAWAVLVVRGHVAQDVFSGGWFVTRAGNAAAARLGLMPAA